VPRSPLSILPGTVEFLALAALARGGRMHGFEILGWVRRTSDDRLTLEEGALYPALHRMEKRGWLEGEWDVSEKGRRAKYYQITAAGRRALTQESRGWDDYVAAVARVMTGSRNPRPAEGDR
jgi:transcriptional regulator